MAEKIKNQLFIFLFILLLAPFIQKNLPFIESGGLNGDFTNAGDADFTWKTWFDGWYQINKHNYYNDQFGFRPDFVRINNQLDFSLFEKVHSNSVIVGKNSCLYQEAYITSYYGDDFMGTDSIRGLSLKLKAIQDTLAKLGKTLIVAYEPTKAYYYPENFPERFNTKTLRPTNINAFRRFGDSLHINQLDFNAWFVSMKAKTKDSLFSKQGIHWTNYGSILAADTLVKSISSLRNIRMQMPQYTEVERTTNARHPDDDINKALNLIFPIVRETFSYPALIYKTDTTANRPRAIYIGDSFFMNIIQAWIPHNINSEWEFWFYFKRVISQENAAYADKWKAIDEKYNWAQKLDSADYVVIMYTTHNLANHGFSDFIEKAYWHYYPTKQAANKNKLAHILKQYCEALPSTPHLTLSFISECKGNG
jgi:hypothetical protein